LKISGDFGTIDSAIAINDQAIVAATGFQSDGVEHTVLINPGDSLDSKCVASDDMGDRANL